jgi:hypothetical protein
MINLKVLSTAAAIALVLPVLAPSISAVQAQDSGRGIGAAIGGGGGARGGGGGGAIGGGGGGGGGCRGGGGGAVFRGGGVAAAPGGGGFRGGPVASTEGRGPGFVRPAPGVGGRTVAGGGYYGGGRYHHHHHRGGFWPGFAIGAGVGSAYGYYDNSPYYYDDSAGYYDDSAVAEGPPVGDDSVAYCTQRYRSYDPASGTYLGNDGLRHPCPAQ